MLGPFSLWIKKKYTWIITSDKWLLIIAFKVKNFLLCVHEYWDTPVCSDVQQTHRLLSSAQNLSLDFWPFIWHCPVISLVLQILLLTWPLNCDLSLDLWSHKFWNFILVIEEKINKTSGWSSCWINSE